MHFFLGALRVNDKECVDIFQSLISYFVLVLFFVIFCVFLVVRYLHTCAQICVTTSLSSIVAWARITTRGIILIGTCMLFTYLHTYLCYNFFSSIVAWARITTRGIRLIGTCVLFTYLHTELCYNFSQQYRCLGKDHHEGHPLDRNVYVIYLPAHRSVLQLLSAVSLPGQGSPQGASSW